MLTQVEPTAVTLKPKGAGRLQGGTSLVCVVGSELGIGVLLAPKKVVAKRQVRRKKILMCINIVLILQIARERVDSHSEAQRSSEN